MSMKTYTVSYYYTASVTVEAENVSEAKEKASEINFSVFTDVPNVDIDYIDGMKPEVYENEITV